MSYNVIQNTTHTARAGRTGEQKAVHVTREQLDKEIELAEAKETIKILSERIANPENRAELVKEVRQEAAKNVSTSLGRIVADGKLVVDSPGHDRTPNGAPDCMMSITQLANHFGRDRKTVSKYIRMHIHTDIREAYEQGRPRKYQVQGLMKDARGEYIPKGKPHLTYNCREVAQFLPAK